MQCVPDCQFIKNPHNRHPITNRNMVIGFKKISFPSKSLDQSYILINLFFFFQKRGRRAKLVTADKNEIDTMFVDRRNSQTYPNGNTLVSIFFLFIIFNPGIHYQLYENQILTLTSWGLELLYFHYWIFFRMIQILPKFVSKDLISEKATLVQVMAWCH